MKPTNIQKSGSTASNAKRTARPIGLTPTTQPLALAPKRRSTSNPPAPRVKHAQSGVIAVDIPAKIRKAPAPKILTPIDDSEQYAFSPPHQITARPSESALLETSPMILSANAEYVPSPRTIFWLRFFAYAIPLTFLCYVLYVNFLPFGYDKTFTITVGAEGDTDSSKEFYLEPSKNLSDRMTDASGTPYRTLSGIAYAVFKPKAVLKDATITVSVEGDGVSIIPPQINFDANSIKWDYSWDLSTSTPTELTGNAFVLDGEVPFNGRDTRLELASSSDLFEDGPFTLYAEWTPKDSEHNAQQIVGHFNWELWQNANSVEFRIGRMNDASGTAYSIKYPVTDDFFDVFHSAVATYNPGDNGYIELYVDGNFAGRTLIGTDTIWKGYGNENLSIGWTVHNGRTYSHFLGMIYEIDISDQVILRPTPKIQFENLNSKETNITLIGGNDPTLKNVKLNVYKN